MSHPIRQTLGLKITQLQGFKFYYPGLDPLHINDWRHDGCGGWFAVPGPVRLQAQFNLIKQPGMVWRSVAVILKIKENFRLNVKVRRKSQMLILYIAISNNVVTTERRYVIPKPLGTMGKSLANLSFTLNPRG